MNHSLYPDNWPALAREIKEANQYTCQSCGKKCRRPGEMYLGWQYELTVAHICQDYEAEAVYVAPMCLECHFPHDAQYSWIARLRQRRLRQRQAGQLEIFNS